jgi:hypothetical protein
MAYMSAREMLSGLPVKMAHGGPVHTSSGEPLYGKGATAADLLAAEQRVLLEMEDPSTWDPATAYAAIMESGVSVQDAIDAGVKQETINAIFTTPTALVGDQLSSQGQTSVIGSGTDFANALTQEGVDAYKAGIMADGVVDAGERLEMQKIATAEGVTYQDMIDFGVDPNILYNTPAAAATTKVCPIGTRLAGQTIGINDDCGLIETTTSFPQTQDEYIPTTVYQPLADNTSVYAAGEESLDRTFRDSAPRTEVLDSYGNLTNFDYTPAASLRSATGSGYNWTPPTVTGRPRSLMGADLLARYTGGRAAADLRQLTTGLGNGRTYSDYTGVLQNPGSYSGGLSKSQLYSRMRGLDYQRDNAAAGGSTAAAASGGISAYLAANPDIAASYESQSGQLGGQSLEQFARNHYNTTGRAEMSAGTRGQFTLVESTGGQEDATGYINEGGGYYTDTGMGDSTFNGVYDMGKAGGVTRPFAHGGSVSVDEMLSQFAEGGDVSQRTDFSEFAGSGLPYDPDKYTLAQIQSNISAKQARNKQEYERAKNINWSDYAGLRDLWNMHPSNYEGALYKGYKPAEGETSQVLRDFGTLTKQLSDDLGGRNTLEALMALGVIGAEDPREAQEMMNTAARRRNYLANPRRDHQGFETSGYRGAAIFAGDREPNLDFLKANRLANLSSQFGTPEEINFYSKLADQEELKGTKFYETGGRGGLPTQAQRERFGWNSQYGGRGGLPTQAAQDQNSFISQSGDRGGLPTQAAQDQDSWNSSGSQYGTPQGTRSGYASQYGTPQQYSWDNTSANLSSYLADPDYVTAERLRSLADPNYWNNKVGDSQIFSAGGSVKKPQGFDDGGTVSSDLTNEELQAQLIALDAQAAPVEEPLDQEQTESSKMFDSLTSTMFTKEGDRSIFGNVLSGIPGALGSVYDYGKDVVTATSPSAKLLADAMGVGYQMKQSAKEDPLAYLANTFPPSAQIIALNDLDDVNKQVNEARRNGNEEEVKRLEAIATTIAIGAFPFLPGKVKPKTPGTAVARGTPEDIYRPVEGELLPAGAGRTSSRELLDELSGNALPDTPLQLEGPAPRPEGPTLAPEVGEAVKMLDKVDNAPALVPEVGDAAKMLDEVDSIPAPKSNLTKTETATLNKSAGRNEERRASAKLAGENFKTNYPVDGGWAPVEITGVKFKNGNAKVTTKKIPYSFQNPPEGVSDDEWAQKLSTGLVDGVENIILRTKNGDQAALDIIAQANWYRTMRNQLRSEFGGIGDVFADIIGATSAQTNVEQNFNNSVDIIRKYSRGDYDLELEAFERRMDQGLKVDGKTLIQMHKAGEFPLITKDSGAMFNSNSPAAMGALLDIFRNIKAGKSPKTPNFTGNLIGLTNEATIDVWAGRKLRDLAGLPRIPPSAEQAVAGAHRVKSTLADPNVGSEFGFGQRVFRKAATELNKSGALKKVFPDLGDLGPDDLQAIVWFIEKEQWTKNGWTTKSGEGGSLDYEMSLLGSSGPSRIQELRREINAGFKPPQQRKVETDSAYQLRTMDALKDFETGRDAAQAELESLSSTADRVVVGISGARPERPMTNYQQAELAAPLDDVVRNDPNVRGYAITSTQGLFMNEAERSLNAEFVVGKGFDPAPLRLTVVELGKEYDQDSVLFSKVVEEGAPNARPGVEIYFKQKLPEEAMKVIVNRLMERGVDGFTYITDSRFSDKINRQFRSGNQPDNAGITGIRFQYVPEFDESFDPQKATEMYKDKLESFWGIVDDIILDETKLKIGKNREVTLGGNVSDARIVHYDTEVFFRGDYDDYIAKHTRPSDSPAGGGLSGGSNNEKANRGSKEGAGPPRAVRDGVGGATSTKANEGITALNKSGEPPSPNGSLAWQQDMGLPKAVADRYWEIGDTQRGAPEMAMVRMQQVSGGGVGSYVAEHLGDISDRMSARHSSWKYSAEAGLNKIKKSLATLNYPYGFEKEFNENLAANAKAKNIPLPQHEAEVKAAMKVYAEEHSQIPVYNKAQSLAKEAAVNYGNQSFDKAIVNLEELSELIGTTEKFRFAMEDYRLDENGNPIEYLLNSTLPKPIKKANGGSVERVYNDRRYI